MGQNTQNPGVSCSPYSHQCMLYNFFSFFLFFFEGGGGGGFVFLDIYRGQSPRALLSVSCQYSKLRKYSAFSDSFVVGGLGAYGGWEKRGGGGG